MPANTRAIFAALLSGIVSAGLVLSVETGSFVRLLLLGLAPLPLFASGLSAGILAAVAASLTGAVILIAAMGPAGSAYYLVAAAVPTVILVWQALRVRRTQDGGAVWYSGGRMLLWLAGLGIAGVVGAVAYLDLFGSGLAAVIRDQLDVPPVAAAYLARVVPGLLVSVWMALAVIDAVVAEWLLVQTGWALRPPVDIRQLTLPLWVGPILMVTGLAGAVLRQGMVGLLCLNCAIVLIVPFAFLGLASIHALARNRPGERIVIAAVYLALLASPALFGWPALLILALMLAGLGSVDQLLDLRDMRGLRTGLRRK